MSLFQSKPDSPMRFQVPAIAIGGLGSAGRRELSGLDQPVPVLVVLGRIWSCRSRGGKR